MNTLIFNYVDVENAFADFFDQHRRNVDITSMLVEKCQKKNLSNLRENA